ncbi:hypothetical protein SPFL3102_00597 [Sporomusaceae bacterium FL31]|nr:hypothetical protein SPFL3101_01354 [Sporomusaceae bacterium FL31]GCE32800.1 hypothetical protein SPFL3102_00597 [Sporomusaceae bacterium]
MTDAIYSFPAIKGIQAGTEYYISMVPLLTLPRLFMFSDEELPPHLRAQRIINKSRIPEMCEYILDNPNSYVFSAITASVDGPISFEPLTSDKECRIGQISIPMSARFLINDGQHRKAAIESALKKNPMLKYEHISVVLFGDMGLKRSQQIFSDLNRYAIRPTKSLNILFDQRSDFSTLICNMADSLTTFKGWVEKERSTIPNRSKALFTLSGLYHGTQALLQECSDWDWSKQHNFAFQYWDQVSKYMVDWQDVINERRKASDLRKKSVSAHSITLIALGRAGSQLLKDHSESWSDKLMNLTKIDWDKSNPVWIGKVVVEGHISGTRSSTQALSDYILQILTKSR